MAKSHAESKNELQQGQKNMLRIIIFQFDWKTSVWARVENQMSGTPLYLKKKLSCKKDPINHIFMIHIILVHINRRMALTYFLIVSRFSINV